MSGAPLNGICPYFTMFPLEFPYAILSQHASEGDSVLDPFCGRGTTNYAGRLLGLTSVGIDSNPVAVALAEAKLANASPQSVVDAATQILQDVVTSADVPAGEFWEWAFHPDVLGEICRLREGLKQDCRSGPRKALRAVVMGALHGPRPKSHPTYLSNQAPRTYAPKPGYAVKFWRDRELRPERVDVLGIIAERAHRYYGQESTTAVGKVLLGDSRNQSTYLPLRHLREFDWVITSPPYYGMRTYGPDQWLRSWFIGGTPTVDYSQRGQLEHSSPAIFAAQLRQVWRNVGGVCVSGARLVVRFGAINDRKVDSLPLLIESLTGSGWEIGKCESAGSAAAGRRQALHFSGTRARALEEHDVWASWAG